MSFRLVYLFIFVLLVFGTANGFDTLKVVAALDNERHEITGSVVYEIPMALKDDDVQFQLYANMFSSPETPYLRRDRDLAQILENNGGYGEILIDSVVLPDGGGRLLFEQSYTTLSIPLAQIDNYSIRKIIIFFTTRIPRFGGRLTYLNNEYLLDQWFPMPALFRGDKWYNPDYGLNSEPISDFYYFDISISLPKQLIPAAPVIYNAMSEEGAVANYQYLFGPAHNFAFAISDKFILDQSRIGDCDLNLYYHNDEKDILPAIKLSVAQTFEYLQEHVGQYIYDDLTIALVSSGLNGGVEFSGMIALYDPSGSLRLSKAYESLVIHEVIHQWFYGALNSDQVADPWLDESVTSYFTQKIVEHYYGTEGNLIDLFGMHVTRRGQNRMFARYSPNKNAMSNKAGDFVSGVEYFSAIYSNGPLVIETLNNLLFFNSDDFWKEYYDQWKYKNPTSVDFWNIYSSYVDFSTLQFAKSLVNDSREFDLSVENVISIPNDSGQFRIQVELKSSLQSGLKIPYVIILSSGDSLHFEWENKLNAELVEHLLADEVNAVVIDPDNLFASDINLLNNSYMYYPESGPALRLSSGLVFLVESLLSFLGGI